MDNNNIWDIYEEELSSLYGQKREDLEEELDSKIKIIFANMHKFKHILDSDVN